MLHHKVGWCTYTRDVTFKKNMDRVFINPRTTRVWVPIIKVIKYRHGAGSDLVSFINNHHKSTKQLSVGSIHEINQGSNPESFNLQILGVPKHHTEEDKFILKLTDGRDLIHPQGCSWFFRHFTSKQILHHQDQWQRDYSKCHQAPRYWLSASSFNSKYYTPWNWHFQNFRLFVMRRMMMTKEKKQKTN